MRKAGCARRLMTESLEHRTLLAGDVLVSVVEGNLMVEGDAEGNSFAIRSGEAPGVFIVAGIPSSNGTQTTINGMTDPVRVDGVRHNVLVNDGAGNDHVDLVGLQFMGNVGIRLGEGDDRVTVGRPAAPNPTPTPPPGVRLGGNLMIGGGDGDDVVLIHRAGVQGRLGIHTGSGNDRVLVGPEGDPTNPTPQPPMPPVFAHRAFIELGEGNDAARIHHTRIGDGLAINAGPGDNVVGLRGVEARAIRIMGNAGNDTVNVERVRARVLNMATGEGDDRVVIRDAMFANLAVFLGSGNDGLTIGRTNVANRAALSGGDGDDRLNNEGENRIRVLRIAGFENGSGGTLQDETHPELTNDLAVAAL